MLQVIYFFASEHARDAARPPLFNYADFAYISSNDLIA
jgi:hypothetical protein